MNESQSLAAVLIVNLFAFLTLIVTKYFERRDKLDDREWQRRNAELNSKERKVIMEKLDTNTELTTHTLRQVAQTQGKTVEDAIQESDSAFENLMARYKDTDERAREIEVERRVVDRAITPKGKRS